jgi:hypothetical protein
MIGFEQRRNCTGELGHSSFFQKVTIALRMIVYGILADIINDHLTMSESQSIKCVKRFVVDIVEAFGLVF